MDFATIFIGIVYLFALLGFAISILVVVLMTRDKNCFLQKVKSQNPKKIWFWKEAFIDQSGVVRKFYYQSTSHFEVITLSRDMKQEEKEKLIDSFPLIVKADGIEYRRTEGDKIGYSLIQYEVL